MEDFHAREQIEELKDEIYHHLHHSFLITKMNLPDLDEEKLVMLFHMFQETSCSFKQVKNYVVTLMLVQIGLDIHHTVEPSNDNEEREIRQLSVLSGDYYSCLCYYLLAKTSEISIIKKVSESIREINEHRMCLYKGPSMTANELLDHLRVVESSLLQRAARHFGLLLWQPFFSEYFLLRRLLMEKKQWHLGSTQIVDSVAGKERHKNFLFPFDREKGQHALQMLNDSIDEVKQGVKEHFYQHPQFETPFHGYLWDTFSETGYIKQKIAKEG